MAELVRRAPESKAVVLTSFSTSDGIAHALEAGAVGAILKSAAETELIPAILSLCPAPLPMASRR